MRNRHNPQYWGKTAAGILFTCEEDNTVMLMYRSRHVDQPHTWGIPGGSVEGEGHYDSEEMSEKEYEDELLWEGAKTEVYEECGSLPPRLSDANIVTHVDYRDGNFLYRNFVVNLTLAQKRGWDIDIENAPDAWENEGWDWFDVNRLPAPLHFGAIYLLEKLEIL